MAYTGSTGRPGKNGTTNQRYNHTHTHTYTHLSSDSCSENQHAAANREDSYEVPIVPLESVLQSSTSAPTPPPPIGMRPHFNGFVWDCQAVSGLAWVNGCPPFRMQQGLPLQHYTMVHSMRSNPQHPSGHRVRGRATMEQV